MSKRICLKDISQLYTGNSIKHSTSLYLEGDSIRGIDKAPDGFQCDEVISMNHQWVLPGLIDLNAEYDLKAALAGGVTTICSEDNPHLPNAPLTCYPIYPVLNNHHLNPITQMRDQGIKLLSIPLESATNNLLLKAYEYASGTQLPLLVQPSDVSLSHHGVAHEGLTAYHLGLKGIPTLAETLEITRHLQLVEHTGTPVHFTQISSKEGLNLILEAKSRGLPVSCDVSIHHLLLNENAILDYDCQAHISPPLRDRDSQQALLTQLLAGQIDALCSQHRPRSLLEKMTPFSDSEPGISSIEILLSFAHHLSPKKASIHPNLIRALTTFPAHLLQQSHQIGQLKEKAEATFTVYDPNQCWKISPDTLLSDGKNMPYLGKQLIGKVTETWVKGLKVYQAEHSTHSIGTY